MSSHHEQDARNSAQVPARVIISPSLRDHQTVGHHPPQAAGVSMKTLVILTFGGMTVLLNDSDQRELVSNDKVNTEAGEHEGFLQGRGGQTAILQKLFNQISFRPI